AQRPVAAEFLLPRAITDHCDGTRALAVVVWREDAARIGPDAKHGEIISRNIFAAHGLRGLAGTAAAHADQIAAGLERGEFAEALGVISKSFVLIVGEQRPNIL